MTTYTFEHAIKMLKQAIEFGEAEGDYSRVRVWAHYVEESHNAEVADMQTELKSADEGLRLFHSIASSGEQSVLSRLDGKVDEVDAVNWQDEPKKLTAREIALPNGQLRSYASYKNIGKAQPLSAEAVDGERLGE